MLLSRFSKGSDDRYLLVNWNGSWTIQDLEGKKRCLMSGSAKTRCPASSENKLNKRIDAKDWSFNKSARKEDRTFCSQIWVHKDAWDEGGVVVHCKVHS